MPTLRDTSSLNSYKFGSQLPAPPVHVRSVPRSDSAYEHQVVVITHPLAAQTKHIISEISYRETKPAQRMTLAAFINI